MAALLLAQAFGLVHRVEHEVGHRPAGWELALALGADAHDHHGHDLHGHDHDDVAGESTHEEGSATCRLIDQAAHADAAPGHAVPPLVPVDAASAPLPQADPAVARAQAHPYRARGPPSQLA